MIKRYIRFLPGLILAFVAITIVVWAIVQEPLESLESGVQQGDSNPIYIPPPALNG